MELVYLWVEEYKNIHRQGFNFSPRFECKFHDEYDEKGKLKDNCKLEIKEDEYIKDFFGENINVTAIVGKNGSGKSSILEILDSLTNDQSKMVLDCKYLLLFEYGKYVTNIDKKTILDVNNFLIEHINYKDIYTLNFFSETSSENKMLERNIDISTKKILELLRVMHQFKIPIDKSAMFTFNPKFITIDKLNSEQLVNKIKISFLNQIGETDIELDVFIDFLDEIQQYEEYEKQFILSKVLSEGVYSLKEFGFDSLEKWIYENLYNGDQHKFEQECKLFIENITTLNSMEFGNITEDQWKFLLFYKDILIYDFIDAHGRRYKDLSHGEKTIFSVFLHITRIIDDYIGRKNCLALFDELDIPLHPYWQKNLLNSIQDVYSTKQNTIHFVFTTHSPFLLSDIPKQNIIFLDTYKQDNKEVKNGEQKPGNCKVVDGLHEKQETFGQNIHTLLSDSFFMGDGLMGEFAKSKINEIIDFHKEVEKIKNNMKAKESLRIEYEKEEEGKPSIKTRFWHTQSIIGDAYLKQVIKNHLVDVETILLGKERAKQEEIKRLRDEADRLEKLS